MEHAQRSRIASWLVGAGLAGRSDAELLRGFCTRAQEAGLGICRGIVFVDTLHPVFEGSGCRWSIEQPEEVHTFEYGPTTEGEAAENWQRSPFFHLLEQGGTELVVPVEADVPPRFPIPGGYSAEGCTAYTAFIHRFDGDDVIGQMDCAYSYWMTRNPGGFSDEALEDLRQLLPAFVLSIKAAALKRIARTVGHVYLGRNTGERMLRGQIMRGVAERIDAVLWYSDLHGYTAISDSVTPAELIPFLNDYADAAIVAVQEAGGEVLKLLGDGLLAIFPTLDPALAGRAALGAEQRFRDGIAAINARRAGEGRPLTSAYVSLHFGEVFYGNIGSRDRLDFTVVGPAVNEVSRIASMCSSVGRDLLVSSTFLGLLEAPERERFVSVGRFALRGVGRAQSLYTLDPALRAGPAVPPGPR